MLSAKRKGLTILPLAAIMIAAWCVLAAWPGEARRAPGQERPSANCAQTSVGYPPLTDMGPFGTYQGFEGGLYPDRLNVPSAAYLQDGLNRAAQVVPRNGSGQPDPVNGRIVLLSIGMSNATQEYSRFKQIADPDPEKNPRLNIVDGAVGGQDATIIRNPNAGYWITVTQRLTSAGATAQQVQAVWLKEAIAGENRPFPSDAQGLQNAFKDIVSILAGRYPNLQLIYLSSRTYAGYASSTLNPEPYAYQSGFAVKWLIQSRVRNGTGAWIGWGPYLWTDGTLGRNDGLVWLCSDTQQDGTHPSATGQQKVAEMLLKFFKTDRTTRGWFLR
jgi:hypothetical protein